METSFLALIRPVHWTLLQQIRQVLSRYLNQPLSAGLCLGDMMAGLSGALPCVDHCPEVHLASSGTNPARSFLFRCEGCEFDLYSMRLMPIRVGRITG